MGRRLVEGGDQIGDCGRQGLGMGRWWEAGVGAWDWRDGGEQGSRAEGWWEVEITVGKGPEKEGWQVDIREWWDWSQRECGRQGVRMEGVVDGRELG